VFKVGDFQASVEEHRTVPPWIGGLVFAAGVVLLVGGSRRRS
jgi:MYXO-CTERM domain-containing protein